MTLPPECGSSSRGREVNISSPHPFCPYVGLQPYTEEQREYFFGREAEQRMIASSLYAAPLTVLYGPSGVGKSSILRAGVIPHLESASRTAVVYFNQWQSPRVGQSFFEQLKSRCLKVVEEKRGEPLGIDGRQPFDELLNAVSQAIKGSVLILLDQFEEYFLYHPEAETEPGFESEFATVVNTADSQASFVIALREDWLARLDRFRVRIPNLLSNTLRLEHMSAQRRAGEKVSAAERAIRGPLEVYNRNFPSGPAVTIEDKLLEAILSQVRLGQFTLSELAGAGQANRRAESDLIETAFLQLVMVRLWEEEIDKANSRALRLSTFERLGGAKIIVQSHLNDLMDQLPNDEREICARMFRFLVTPRGAKIAHETSDLVAFTERRPDEAAPVLSVLGKLSEARVLRRIFPPERYEIFHDVLAPAVLDWRARYVQEQERAEAQKKAAQEAAERERESLRERELAQARALAEAEHQQAEAERLRVQEQRLRMEEQTRAARRFRLLFAAAAVVAAVALVLGVLAAMQRKEARQQARLANSRKLASISLTRTDDHFDLALLLAREAYRILPSLEAQKTLESVLASNSSLIRFLPGPGVPEGVTLDPDGRAIATATCNHYDESTGEKVCTDFAIRILDVNASHPPDALLQHAPDLTSFGFSPTGRLFGASGCAEFAEKENQRVCRQGVIHLWDSAARLAPIDLFTGPDSTGHDREIRAFDFAPTDKVIASGGDDGTIALWDVEAHRQVRTLQAPKGQDSAVLLVGFSEDGKNLASASADGSIRRWQTSDWKPVEPTRKVPSTSAVLDYAFSPDLTTLAVLRQGDVPLLWNLTKGDAPRKLPLPKDEEARVIVFSPSGKQLVSGDCAKAAEGPAAGGKHHAASECWQGKMHVWDVDSAEPLRDLTGFSSAVRAVASSVRVALVVSASDDGSTILWDPTGGQSLGHARKLEFAPPSEPPAPGGESPIILSEAPAAKPTVHGLAVSPNGQELALGMCGQFQAKRCTQGRVSVVDISTGRLAYSLHGHADRVYSVAFSPQRATLASGSRDGTIQLWDTTTHQQRGPPLAQGSWVRSLAFSPDGKVLASGGCHDRGVNRNGIERCSQGEIHLWDVSTLTKIGSAFTLHTGPVYSLSFQNNQTLVSTSRDGLLALDVTSRTTKPMTLEDSQYSVTEFALSLGGTLAVSGGGDAIVLVDYATRQQVGELPLTGRISALAFTPDSKQLISLGASEVTFWDVNPQSWLDRACRIANRNLTPAEWKQYLGDEPYRATCP